MTERPRSAQGATMRVGALATSLLFLRLGAIAFGGPAAHVALMRDEFVRRRKWLTDQHFMDLLGITNLIPGPNSTEMAIHLGFVRSGWAGLIGAGIAFILPAALMVGILAWAYVAYGSTPQAEWLLYGVRPVIIAVVVTAIWGLARTILRKWHAIAVAVAVIGPGLLGVNELALLFGGAAVGTALKLGRDRWESGMPLVGALLPLLGPSALTATIAAVAAPISLTTLGLTFLKIGAVLYGGGYVLVAFMRGDFVDRLGWLTDQQLLDAIAIGQLTPGPLFTSATFVGFLLAGTIGAVIATVAIFLPSFVFVAAVGPFVTRIRQNRWSGAMLDGVNAAALGLMAVVTVQLGRDSVVDVLTAALAVGTLGVLVFTKLSSVWIILGGAMVGVAAHLGGG